MKQIRIESKGERLLRQYFEKLRSKTSEEKCPQCGDFLMQIKWNKDVDIIFCNNVKCSRFRLPVRHVKQELWNSKGE